jgi:large subunit ribosomal protein L13
MRTRAVKITEVQRAWHLVDAQGQTLGRLASTLAHYLRGKHKPEYTPNTDTGDFLVVINASKISVTGKKEEQKMYHRHSGYPGGLKSTSLGAMRAKKPEMIIYLAVKGMLPRTPLARSMIKKLNIYPNEGHPHMAQKPQPLMIPLNN